MKIIKTLTIEISDKHGEIRQEHQAPLEAGCMDKITTMLGEGYTFGDLSINIEWDEIDDGGVKYDGHWLINTVVEKIELRKTVKDITKEYPYISDLNYKEVDLESELQKLGFLISGHGYVSFEYSDIKDYYNFYLEHIDKLSTVQKEQILIELKYYEDIGLVDNKISNSINQDGYSSKYLLQTNPNTEQYAIKITDDIWLYSEQDISDDSGFKMDEINLTDYSESDLEFYVSGYYKDVAEVKKNYKDDWKQIVAECIFEMRT